MSDLFSTALAFLMSPGFLVGAVVGMVAAFGVWWLLRDLQAQGLAAAVTFVAIACIVGAVVESRREP